MVSEEGFVTELEMEKEHVSDITIMSYVLKFVQYFIVGHQRSYLLVLRG